MRRNLYKRVVNQLVEMNTPRMTLRETYVSVGNWNKRIEVEGVRPGKIEVTFVEYVQKGIKARFKIYKNQKAIGDIKSFLK